MIRPILRSLAVVALALSSALAQTPAPVVIQAVRPVNVPTAAANAPAAAPSVEAALQALQSLKAANEETLKKQAATLQQLEELEKAAEQIKIYSKRG
jgi:hypothetical protein